MLRTSNTFKVVRLLYILLHIRNSMKKKVTISIDPRLRKQINPILKRNGQKLSTLIAVLINKYIKDNFKEDDKNG